MNDLDQFLQDVEQDESKVDILNQPLDPNAQEPDEEPVDNEEGKYEDEYDEAEYAQYQPRNRRERRLMEKLEAERSSAMQLSQRLEAMSGAQRAMTEEEADYLKSVERIYGTDSPEAEMATNLLKQAFNGVLNDAEQRAYQRLMQEQESQVSAVREAEEEIDYIVDEIMDTYGVDLSPEQEVSYLQLMERMSPKDRNGEVIGLADPHAVWEVFTERSNPRSNAGSQARDLASRSLTDGTSSEPSTLNDDVHQRFLRENGII